LSHYWRGGDIVSKYELACFYQDYKDEQLEFAMWSHSLAKKMHENILCSSQFVENVIHTFNENPRLGLLSATPPNFEPYYCADGYESGRDFRNIKKLLAELDIKVPFGEDSYPISTFGTNFWFRPKAFNKLFKHGFMFEDLRRKLAETGSTPAQIFEQSYGCIVQGCGYYPAYLLNEKFASAEITRQNYHIRNLNRIAHNNGFIGSLPWLTEFYSIKLAEIDRLRFQMQEEITKCSSIKYQLRLRLHRKLPKSLFSSLLFIKCLLFRPRKLFSK
jgi:rhamnosyltransferase